MAIWILNFPLPPSVNSYLMPVAGKLKRSKTGRVYRQGHLVKTKSHQDYQTICYQWAALQGLQFQRIRDDLQSQKRLSEKLGAPFSLRVDCFFAFDHERVLTTNRKVQRLDADNRLKPCRDALSNLLEIDDKHFFSGLCEKITTQGKAYECTILRISQFKPRTLQEIRHLALNPESPGTW